MLIVGIMPINAMAYDENDPGEVEITEQVLCRVQKGGVFQNFTVLDEKPCNKIVMPCRQYQGSKSCPIAYHWPSGAKTIVEYNDKHQTYPVRINGQRAISPNAIADHTCVLNTKSENLFCEFSLEGEPADEMENLEVASTPSNPKPESKFTGLKGQVEKQWNDKYDGKVIVESIEMLWSDQNNFMGISIMEAKFKSIVRVDREFRAGCISLRPCLTMNGISESKLPIIKQGSYEDITTFAFEKAGSFWKLAPN